MKCDIVVAGVGGQGILSLAALVASAAMDEGFEVKQSEVHGMAQRGGAVSAHLRMADEAIFSDLIPDASAEIIASLEPLEGLRHLRCLSPQGTLITSIAPVRNIPDYPDLEELLHSIRSLPRAWLLDADELARQAGSAQASNMVLVGAASHLLPVDAESLESQIRRRFGRKGDRVVQANLTAFRAGREAVACPAS